MPRRAVSRRLRNAAPGGPHRNEPSRSENNYRVCSNSKFTNMGNVVIGPNSAGQSLTLISSVVRLRKCEKQSNDWHEGEPSEIAARAALTQSRNRSDLNRSRPACQPPGLTHGGHSTCPPFFKILNLFPNLLPTSGMSNTWSGLF